MLGFDAQAALADDPGHAAVRELSLGLDVAQTEELAEPFAAWHGAARKLADDLDAAIVCRSSVSFGRVVPDWIKPTSYSLSGSCSR